jgi:hypothetical protein
MCHDASAETSVDQQEASSLDLSIYHIVDVNHKPQRRYRSKLHPSFGLCGQVTTLLSASIPT